MPEAPRVVFISYADKDHEFVERLKANLISSGFVPWANKHDPKSGQGQLQPSQQVGIDQCLVVLVVISPHAAQADHVRTEYSYAQGQQKDRIPLIIQPAPQIPAAFNTTIPPIDFRNYDQGLQKLLQVLNNYRRQYEARMAASAKTQSASQKASSSTGLGALVGVIFLTILLVGVLSSHSALQTPQNPPYRNGDPIDGIGCDASPQALKPYQTHLQIYINGQPFSIPNNVGRQSTTGCLYWLHTNAGTGDDGVIHITAPEESTFTLHQFFDIWGQQLSAINLLGHPVDADHQLTLYVYTPLVQPAKNTQPYTVTPPRNLKPYIGDPAKITLMPHELIVLEYGSPVMPPPSWTFLASE